MTPLIFDPEVALAALDEPRTAKSVADRTGAPLRMVVAGLWSLYHQKRVTIKTSRKGVARWSRT